MRRKPVMLSFLCLSLIILVGLACSSPTRPPSQTEIATLPSVGEASPTPESVTGGETSGEPTLPPPEVILPASQTPVVVLPTDPPPQVSAPTATLTARPSPTVASIPTPASRLNLNDPQTVVDWFLYALASGERAPLEQMVPADKLSYVMYIEGGQSVTNQEILADFAARLPNGATCDYIAHDSTNGYLQVWASDWNPPWQMTEMCYVECEELDPPVESSTVGFFFSDQGTGWMLRMVWINEDDWIWKDVYQSKQISCDGSVSELMRTPSQSCPGAPPQRLYVGAQGTICTQSDAVFFRSGPGKNYEALKSLSTRTSFTVIGGPSCADNWSWWEVRLSNGETGWLAEGGDEEDPYFLCPAE